MKYIGQDKDNDLLATYMINRVFKHNPIAVSQSVYVGRGIAG